MTDGLTIGWFGKLPCAGDFVYRRLPFTVIDAIDDWLRQGLGHLRATYPAQWRDIYDQAPTWNFAVPAAATICSMTLIGLVAPSHDRVGREFPLCAAVALPRTQSAAPLLAAAHAWLADLGRLALAATSRPTTIDAFDSALQLIALPSLGAGGSSGNAGDDILEALAARAGDVVTVPMPLAHALPWPELPTVFDPAGTTSYWWTNTAGGDPLRGMTSDAGLAPSLMLTLLRPPFGMMHGRR